MQFTVLRDNALLITFGIIITSAIAWSIFAPPTVVKKEVATASSIPERNDDLVLLDAIRGVNADASVLMLSPYFSLGLDEPITCLLARKLGESPDAKGPLIAQLAMEQSRECTFARLARKFTLPVFQSIASTRALPNPLFTFAAFSDDKWVNVGPFKELEVCSSVQLEGMKLGIGTKACSRWTPRF